MVKPFEEEEMLLWVSALLWRAKILTERKLTVGNTELIYDSLTGGLAQHRCCRRKNSFCFINFSFNNKTFTRRQLMDEIWDLDTESDEHTVNVHINKLRTDSGITMILRL